MKNFIVFTLVALGLSFSGCENNDISEETAFEIEDSLSKVGTPITPIGTGGGADDTGGSGGD